MCRNHRRCLAWTEVRSLEESMKQTDKITAFQSETGTKDTLQLTFITTYGVKKNKYSGIVQNEVTMDDLFA